MTTDFPCQIWPETGPYPCQVCGAKYPDAYLFDLKGDVPGGCKVTCLECKGRLEEREAILSTLRLLKSSHCVSHEEANGVQGAIDCVRARTP